MSASDAQRAADGLGRGIALTILAMLAFALMDAISKLLAERYSISQMMWVRYVVFTVFALALVRGKGLANVARSGRPWLQLSRALLLVVENGIFVLAFIHLPLADVHAVAAASPLIVIALSVPLLGEKVGIRRWLAVLAGFAGVLLIVRPGFQTLEWPVAIPVAGAILWGLYQVMVRLCSRTDSADTTLLWSAVVGLAVFCLIGPFTWVEPTAADWALLLVLGLLGSAGHYALIKALVYAEAGAIQPYCYTLLLFAALLGVIVFGDIPDAWTFSGAAIVISSGLYAWYRERKRKA
jgi:drug/metabolite transporter (DMT)-like permease